MPNEFTQAIRAGDIQSVLSMIQAGADVNKYTVKESIYDHEDGKTPLIIAADLGNAAVIQCLLEHGADLRLPSVHHQSLANPLMYAAGSGNYASVKLLIDWRAEVNAHSRYGMTALMWAANRGNNIIVRLLLRRGADINAQAETYYLSGQRKGITTPLTQAVINGRYWTVLLLLKYGANNTGQEGFIALSIAQSKGYRAIVRLLQSA